MPIATAQEPRLQTNGVKKSLEPMVDHLDAAPSSTEYKVWQQPMGTRRAARVIIVGAGVSGVTMVQRINKFMKDVEFVVYEKNEDVGGTWLENKYPGCRCDVPSVTYQFSWAPNEHWPQFYSNAGEILKYFKRVCHEHKLLDNVKLRHQVIGAEWNADTSKWEVKVQNTETGVVFDDECDFFVSGTGILNNWKWPNIPKLDSFKGQLVHTARWPDAIDLSSKRVGVIGVGSSSVQVIPQIQPIVQKLTAFIRSPTWITPNFAAQYAGPNGSNFFYSEEQHKEFEDYEKYLDYRKKVEQELSYRYKWALKDSDEQAAAKAAAKEEMIRMLKGKDELIEKLIPTFAVGCRRPTPGNGFLEALQEDNVATCMSPISHASEKGLVTNDGVEHELDVIIAATGFDNSFAPRFPVIGREGKNLQDLWADGKAESYMSIMTSGFPNYLIFSGPSYPAGHGSVMPVIELLANYFCKMIYKWQIEPNLLAIEPTRQAQDEFNVHRNEQLKSTCWASHCSSWFKNGKPDGPLIAMHPGSRTHFFLLLKNPRWQDYSFKYDGNRYKFSGMGFTTKETAGQDLTWYLDPEDDHNNLQLEI